MKLVRMVAETLCLWVGLKPSRTSVLECQRVLLVGLKTEVVWRQRTWVRPVVPLACLALVFWIRRVSQ